MVFIDYSDQNGKEFHTKQVWNHFLFVGKDEIKFTYMYIYK